MTDPLIEQIKAEAEKGTRGNWRTRPVPCGNNIYADDTFVCSVRSNNPLPEHLEKQMQIDARRIARVPEMEARILADEEEKAELRVAIKRQAGAAKTLRKLTLDEVQHLKNMDRSEYNAAKTLDSERDANAILTDEVERLTAKRDAALQRANMHGGRYWEGRWRDEAAENERLRQSLKNVLDRLEASLFTNAEHAQAKELARSGLASIGERDE